jgi:hypothetical protein
MMKESVRKLDSRCLWVLPIALTVYLTVACIDFVWYRSYVPVRFQSANWEGRWETRRYWGLSGRLLVLLPDPLPQGVDFKAEALVYYPVYSVWRTGQFVRMDFMGHFRPESPTSGGQSTNPIPTGGGMLKFKGIVGNQVVEYAALIDGAGRNIVGGYLSQDPDDRGSFWLSLF